MNDLSLKFITIFIIVSLICIFKYHNVFNFYYDNSYIENISTRNLFELNNIKKTYDDTSEWYNIKIPSKSYFGFDTLIINTSKWELAKIQAHNGEHVLLQRILKLFPSHLNFLDGDTLFRRYHDLADVFIDRNRDLQPITNKSTYNQNIINKKKKPYPWEAKGFDVLPKDYTMLSKTKRAAIVKVGYFAFKKVKNSLFGGSTVGKALLHRDGLLAHWNKSKNHIVKPFIALDTHDENWGLLSTHFPNRTAKWGYCCTNEKYDYLLQEFLDHNKTIMILINQHSNITHPKIITTPRGLPQHTHRNRIIWDTMRIMIHNNIFKNKLLYTSITNSVSRPQITACIEKNFIHLNNKEVLFHKIDSKNRKIEIEKREKLGDITYRREYYRNLATTRVGLAIPGIGYDTYRLWELLILGSMPVLERGVGLDRTLWRLPALLVDDFADVTPELIRAAYVEALYRVDEFEFERLTQSFWWDFIMNVAKSKQVNTILEKFPYQETNFMRPLDRFDCHNKNQCGKGTKYIPMNMC